MTRRWSPRLEISAMAFAAWSLVYRSTLYWILPGAGGDKPGTADVLDLAFALLLFLICCLCSVSGVALSMLGDQQDKRRAYRPFLVGVLSFLAYDILHPHMPRLL